MSGSGVRVIGGRYALEGLIATGGMGQVWRGRDTLLDRPVAVKLLRAEYSGDDTVCTRFRTEAQLAGRLTHRNIAALFDYGEQVDGDGVVCAHLVMELVDGEPLSALLAREGPLPPDRVLDLVGQTAAGLAAAHAAGVVHRDVKPGNLLVGRDGVVRITDFGIAWSAGSMPLTRTGQVVGTAHYLSPEQAAGGKAGPASDVYALGMVAWECLTGRRAFDGENPVQIALMQIREEPAPLPDGVPAPVRELVARMLVKDPAGRPADGAALLAVVDAVRSGSPLPPAPPPVTAPLLLPAPPPAGRPPRRRFVARALAAAGTLAAGAVLGVGVLQLAGTGSGAPPAAVADAAPAGVDVRRAEVVGRGADEVEDQLVAAGLRVTRVSEQSAGAAAGTVLAVTPVGRLALGDLVTLTVAVAPPPAAPSSSARTGEPAPAEDEVPWSRNWPTRDGGGYPAGDAGSGVVSPAPATSAPAAPEAAVPEVVVPAPVAPAVPAPDEVDEEDDPDAGADAGPGNGAGQGNGNAGGNGNGNGNGNGGGNGRGRDG
ncbi:serine/threonine protein kinase [Geodermatophilus sp. SYSU D00766]